MTNAVKVNKVKSGNHPQLKSENIGSIRFKITVTVRNIFDNLKQNLTKKKLPCGKPNTLHEYKSDPERKVSSQQVNHLFDSKCVSLCLNSVK